MCIAAGAVVAPSKCNLALTPRGVAAAAAARQWRWVHRMMARAVLWSSARPLSMHRQLLLFGGGDVLANCGDCMTVLATVMAPVLVAVPVVALSSTAAVGLGAAVLVVRPLSVSSVSCASTAAGSA